MLVFSNPGEIDIRAATIMGVNVKPNNSPIGYFGTGLKYAIAGILRLGGEISIYSGETFYTFSLQKDLIRGKEFGLIFMSENGKDPMQLGFTAEYGKAWEPWMYYRELYSNAVDKMGQVQVIGNNEEIIPAENLTIIVVNCDKLLDAHLRRDEFILSAAPILKLPTLEVINAHGTIFYRGIKIYKATNAVFSYNLLEDTKLTEDRTMAYTWLLADILRRAYQQCEDYNFIKQIIKIKSPFLEGTLEWNWYECGETFKKVALDLYETQSAMLPVALFNQIWAERILEAPSLPLDLIQKKKKDVRKS